MSEKGKSKKQIRQERHQGKQKRQRLIQAGVIGLVLLLAVGYLLWPRPQALAVSPERLNDDPFLGAAEAPVTIVEYGDFGCPSCRAWPGQTLTQAMQRVQAASTKAAPKGAPTERAIIGLGCSASAFRWSSARYSAVRLSSIAAWVAGAISGMPPSPVSDVPLREKRASEEVG